MLLFFRKSRQGISKLLCSLLLAMGAHTDGLTQLHELLGDLSDGMGGFLPDLPPPPPADRVVSVCDVYLLQIAEKSI